jgi:hypothetical protein
MRLARAASFDYGIGSGQREARMNKAIGICLRVTAVLAIGASTIVAASPAQAAFYGYGYRGYYGPRFYGYRYPFYYGYPAYYGYPYAYGPPVYAAPRVVYAPPVVVVAPPAPVHRHARVRHAAARRVLPSCIPAPGGPLQGPLPPQG